ncbi:MAG: TolC family outer membrane protein [Proteobacteria bacterium]|nr:TolC family outer membrane protein [Pseudomonadota bacterium]
MNALSAFRAGLVLLLSLGTAGAYAQNVAQVFRDAKDNDATYAATRFALEAGREKLPQGRALMLPSLNLSANVTEGRIESDSRNVAVSPSFVRRPGSYGYTLSFSQPLYRPQNALVRDQAEFQVRQSEAVFGQAGQDLIVRVAQAYFDILASIDTLGLVRAQKAAISEQLAQAKRNFEVGTATITDTHEAQARYDLILAQEIAAQNDRENKERALQQITGKEYQALKPLRVDVQLSGPTPATLQAWVDLSKKQGYPVRIQDAVSAIATLEAQRARAGHRPTLDLVASHGQSGQNASIVSSVGSDTTSSSISLQLALPLYQGGAINSGEREAAANAQKSKQDLEAARRAAALSAQQSYLAVINGIAQVKALEQALVSSQSALDSNKLGYEVGVRINIDVLNAQQQLFSTRRDLALARYNTITNHLKLKAAAGSLREEDLEEVNRALAP